MTTTATVERDSYVMGRSAHEYERLRTQARQWNDASGRMLDVIGIGPGDRCLDAGCGPGETMRLMAERIGLGGRVLGLDVDAGLADTTRSSLRAEGHAQCDVRIHDLTEDAAVPGAPYDLVYARLLLFHLPERVAVLRRLWDAVAPGGHLLVQDYDVGTVGSVPALSSIDDVGRLIVAGMTAAGCEVRVGALLPHLFGEASLGRPDGTDVAGHLEPLVAIGPMLRAILRSVLPAAVAHGVTTHDQAERALGELARDESRAPDLPVLGPLLVSAWKRKTPGRRG